MSIDYCLIPDTMESFQAYINDLELAPEEKNQFACVKVLKVNIFLQPAMWDITVSLNGLSLEKLHNIADLFCNHYGLTKVNFISCEEKESWLDFIKEYLLSLVSKNCPDIYLLLKKGNWDLQENTLQVAVESSFALERIKQKKVDKFSQDILTNKLKTTIKINFNATNGVFDAISEDFITEDYLNAVMVSESEKNNTTTNGVILGSMFKGEPRPIAEIQEEERRIVIEGVMHRMDVRELRTGRLVLRFDIFDSSDGIRAKMHFDNKEKFQYETRNFKEGQYVKVMGDVQHDPYERNELVLTPRNIVLVEKDQRMDNAKEKRIELHAHTKMSALDSVMNLKDYIKCAANWGHEAVAITDHGVVQAFPEAYSLAQKFDIKVIYGMEGYLIDNPDDKMRARHIIILAESQKGLRNLYKLVSLSHLQYFYKRPRLPKKVLEEYREGLILGSACEAGELFQAILNKESEEKIQEIAEFYDFLEIQPNGNNRFLIRQGKAKDEDELCEINKKIVALGKQLNKPVVATCDVHFLQPEDEIYRRILQGGQGYRDADQQPPIYFRTTEEMFAEFSYLGDELAKEVIVDNPRAIASRIPKLQPIPDELYSPQIPGAADDVYNMSYQNAHKLYGENLPQTVIDRLKLELDSIIGNGFSELYLIAHKLVKKSNTDGYLVGSRGSVGSSFVATMMDITEVNPLPPHYRCAKCCYSEFIEDGSVGAGFDLPKRNCPNCSEMLIGEGHNIPFAVFLGFHGDKVPDIDLNFSGEYQPLAHKYTEELFGRANVFRAGTISTIADRTAAGFARKYYDERNLNVRSARIDSIIPGCTGVKRTTGQHPGGIMVVPRDMDIHFFTPVQRPADDTSSNTITTHFDYHSISDRLVKLDILGHDDPTVIKMLEEMTGKSPNSISFSDEKTTSIFSSTQALGLTPQELGSSVGTLGIPEFGTRFVRQMLEDTKPKCFSELVRISGYSHGTDVWLNNAQDLIKSGTANVSETISARDDIMIYLIQKGVEPLIAFKTMEDVRKGKGVKEDYQKAMREKNVPEWYIESCQKIKYMFPKAHAVAYVMMAYRIAYCKVHYPKEFYAAYFSIRADDFDADLILQGNEAIKSNIKQIEQKGREASDKEKRLVTILELAYEMGLRKINFERIDLYKSHPTKFLIVENGLLPPLTALAGVGKNAAINIDAARQGGPFISQDELRIRSGVSKTVIETLVNHGCLDDLPKSNQVSLF